VHLVDVPPQAQGLVSRVLLDPPRYGPTISVSSPSATISSPTAK